MPVDPVVGSTTPWQRSRTTWFRVPVLWRRLAYMVLVVGLGWAVAESLGLGGLVASPGYLTFAHVLLAVGLLGSTYGISVGQLAADRRTLLLAVSVGVFVKTAIISGLMYLCFRRPEYLVLGVAVAQIDPLSVAAMLRNARMSARATSLLAAWASFDDPVTVLLAVYLSAFALSVSDGVAWGGKHLVETPSTLLLDVVGNLGLVLVAGLCWWASRRLGELGDRARRPVEVAQVVVLVLLVGAAVHWSLFLGLAVTGLFFRPRPVRTLDPVVAVAFYVAAAALGFVLVGGVAPGPGIVLGVLAFGAQIPVAWILTRGGGFTRSDRRCLMFGQQNGITAVILALVLESRFPGTVAIIAPAILVVNLLHAGVHRGKAGCTADPVPA